MYVEDDILRFAGRGMSNKYRESQVNREIYGVERETSKQRRGRGESMNGALNLDHRYR